MFAQPAATAHRMGVLDAALASSDSPFELPREYELVLDLKVAGARGLTILPALLSRADAVFQ